jgi:hypothetical protein
MAFRWPTVAQIDELAGTFRSSRVATAIRIANVDSLPVIVACYSQSGRLWRVAAPHVPRRWWLKDTLDHDTFAYDLLTSGAERHTPRPQSADAWFQNNDAGEFEVLEQCFAVGPGKGAGDALPERPGNVRARV